MSSIISSIAIRHKNCAKHGYTVMMKPYILSLRCLSDYKRILKIEF